MERQTGTTTEQMKSAPKNALFIWCNNCLYYPMMLARHLGRTDLTIENPGWLTSGNGDGRRSFVVVDHAARLNVEQIDALERIEAKHKLGGIK